jgi:inosine/xanthosine triphosphatase
MQIALGTTSKDKEKIANKILADLQVKGELKTFSASSGVADQPVSKEETIKGASNRARAALTNLPQSDIGLGLEGGLCKVGNLWYLICATVIVDKLDKEYLGVSKKMALPKEVSKKIDNGAQFGQVIREFKGVDTQLITREKSFSQALKKAFSVFNKA